MNLIQISPELLQKFGTQAGEESTNRLIKLIEKNTPPLLWEFATENSLPVDMKVTPTEAFAPDTLRTAKAAHTVSIIQALQEYLDSLNKSDTPNASHDHGHGSCKCSGDCNCGGHGGCNCGGHDTNK